MGGNQEEFGVADATPEEWKKLKEDDCLMWRMVSLAMVDHYLRKARGCPHSMGFGVEQPASPKDYKPEVVSWWDTQEWRDLREEFGWSESTSAKSLLEEQQQSQPRLEGI